MRKYKQNIFTNISLLPYVGNGEERESWIGDSLSFCLLQLLRRRI